MAKRLNSTRGGRWLVSAALGLALVITAAAQDVNPTPDLTLTLTTEVLPTLAPEITAEPTVDSAATATALAITPATVTSPPSVTASPTGTPEGTTTYVVRAGDTLARVAGRFGTTVEVLAALNNIVNINLIFVGQVLRVPEVAGTATATATPTAEVSVTPTVETTPTATVAAGPVYVVQPGDTLARIALRFDTTTTTLIALNNLRNPNVIYVGQRLTLPAGSALTPTAPTVTPAATSTSAPTEGPTAMPTLETADAFAYGLALLSPGDASVLPSLVEATSGLGVTWVRLDVPWREIEAAQGAPDFAALDPAVTAFDAAGLNILLTVATAPDWARSRLEESGPPDDFAAYAAFVEALAGRYAGVVDAYQVWYEPNLRREWFSEMHRISPQSYMELLRPAYAAIKRADPAALVIAAGLAPTGFNDGFNAINDRVFLAGLYAEGVVEVSDALAAHPGGWANPPDATCCEAAAGVESHYQDRSFYFLDTLNDYRALMIQNRDPRPLWVTKFGWGSSADTTVPGENSGYNYVAYTDLEEQAAYTVRAYVLADELGFVGPAFVHNLNGCAIAPVRAEFCYTSLLGPDGGPRPVFNALAATDKP